jgi:hypothetical protein
LISFLTEAGGNFSVDCFVLYSIYVDTVINHLTGHGMVGTGVAGSSFDAPSQSYPAIPFSTLDFNQPFCEIANYNDPVEVSTIHGKSNKSNIG